MRTFNVLFIWFFVLSFLKYLIGFRNIDNNVIDNDMENAQVNRYVFKVAAVLELFVFLVGVLYRIRIVEQGVPFVICSLMLLTFDIYQNL